MFAILKMAIKRLTGNQVKYFAMCSGLAGYFLLAEFDWNWLKIQLPALGLIGFASAAIIVLVVWLTGGFLE